MLTAGTLAGTQELMASWLAKDRNKHGNYFTARVPKMAAYGALVSAPLGHFLIWVLQKSFKNRVSLRAKIIQILISNLIVSYLQILKSLSRLCRQNSAMDGDRVPRTTTRGTCHTWSTKLTVP